VTANVRKFSYSLLVCFNFRCIFNYTKDNVRAVIFSVLSWTVGDREFDPLSGQIKVYENCICCFAAKPATLRSRCTSKDWFERHVYMWTAVQ